MTNRTAITICVASLAITLFCAISIYYKSSDSKQPAVNTSLWRLNSATVREKLGVSNGFQIWAVDTDAGELHGVVFCGLPPVWKGLHGDFYFEHHDQVLDVGACDELLKVVRDFKELKK